MKVKTPLLIIGGAVAYIVYRLMQTKNTVEQLRYFVSGVKYNKSNSTALRSALTISLTIENPTSNAVTFNRFIASVSIKGQPVTSIEVNGMSMPITFKPGNTVISMDAIIEHLKVLQILPGIISQLTSGNFSEMINVTGTLYAGGLTIPVSNDIKLSF